MAKKTGKTKKAAKRKTSAKKVSKKTVAQAAAQPVAVAKKLPSAWQLTKLAAQTLWDHKELFAGITLIYGVLNLILVHGFSSGTDVGSLKQSLGQAFSGHFGALVSGLSIFAVLLGSAGNSSSPTAGAYQLILLLIGSLAVIWALRKLASGSVVRVRDAYYRGMYPLVPLLLVLSVIALQLLPLLIGSSLYALAVGGGIAVNAPEKLIFIVIFAALAFWSLYMVSASLFAIYIVTLPDLTPLAALRSSRELVKGRRWLVLRKILFLPVVLLIASSIVMLPIIAVLTPLSSWIFFLLTSFSLAAVHAYMYTLYRELI